MTSPNEVCSSSSVRIRYPDDAAPKTLQSAYAQLSKFGEISELDVSMSALNGCVVVTYFDLRSAQRALAAHAQFAELSPGASCDFRRVRFVPRALQEAVAKLGGFDTFGEIASVTRNGGHIVIEFFDLRSAPKVIFSVMGAEPFYDPVPDTGAPDPDPAVLPSAHLAMLTQLDHLCTLMVAQTAAQSAAQSFAADGEPIRRGRAAAHDGAAR